MVKKSIKVLISPEGEATVEAIGYKGQSCEEATRWIERALGKTLAKKVKPERFQTEVHHEEKTRY